MLEAKKWPGIYLGKETLTEEEIMEAHAEAGNHMEKHSDLVAKPEVETWEHVERL